jgi:CRISPR-associated protein Cas2
VSFVVLRVSATPDRLRGALSRWLVELATGLYVGNMSARVRLEVWDLVTENLDGGEAVLVAPAQNEQGYEVLLAGVKRRRTVDLDGLTLVVETHVDGSSSCKGPGQQVSAPHVRG